MSNTVPQQQSRADAARSDAPSLPHADTPLPDFQTSSPIELEIARSERASAALAATRALTRAAFTDSQLAAEAVGGDAEFDASDWIRTEYAALDHTVAARPPQNDPASAAHAATASGRNLIAGSFNPGLASLQARAFPSASIANSPIRTREGNQARFLQESRLTPRATSGAGASARIDLAPAAGAAHGPKPPTLPTLAAARPRPRGPIVAPAAVGDSVKFVLAVGLGVALVLMGGGVAWKAGWLSRTGSADASLVSAQMAAQAEAARLLAASPQPIDVAPPAAGMRPPRTDAEVDAALAAAARAAAVPVASVHAAGPSRVARSSAPVAPVAAPARAPVSNKDGVAAAIASAQARADKFLSSGSGAPVPASDPPRAP